MWKIVSTLPRRWSLKSRPFVGGRSFSKSKYEDYYASIDDKKFTEEIEDDESTKAEEEKWRQQQEIKEELDARKGRGWSDPWELEA